MAAMPTIGGPEAERGQRFARRMYVPRVLGLAAGAICVGGGLWQLGAPAWVWVVLFLQCFVWPHIAYPLAMRAKNPYRAERRNLVFDSAMGGVWVAAIAFNPVPSAVLVSMLAMDKAAVGGFRLLVRCLAAQAAAAVVVGMVAGFRFAGESSFVAQLAALPLLLAYPVTVGYTAYHLARRVRDQNVALAEMSSIDGLTGLLNRSHWERAVTAEFQRCRRIGHSSAVLMLDIDHFKRVNDEHGHAAGDAVLRQVAAIIRDTVRAHDAPGRYGGEEFGVVLPGIDAAGAEAIAERIRKRIEATVMDEPHGVRITVSIGYAAIRADDANYEAWVARSDKALYAAKAAGRNCSMSADSVGAPARVA